MSLSHFGNRLKEILTQTWQATKLVRSAAPGWTLINIVLVMVQSLLPLAALLLMKQIVDAVTSGTLQPDKQAAFGQVLLWIILAAVVAVLSALCTALAGLAAEGQALQVTDHVLNLLQSRSVEVDLEFYENPDYFNTLHRAQKEAPYRPVRIVNGLVEAVRNSLSLGGIAILIFSFHWWIGLALFVAAMPAAMVKIHYSRKLYDYENLYAETERKAWYFHWLMTDSHHAREIRIFQLGRFFMAKFRGMRDSLRLAKLSIARKKAVGELSAQVITTTVIFATFAFICHETLIGTISLGSLVMYYQGFQRGLGFLRASLSGLAGLYENSLFLSQFYRIIEMKPSITAPVDPVPISESGSIEIKNLNFTYPGCAVPALHNLSVTIPENKLAAVIGENGSGKTTLVKLLCRLYDPASGSIYYNGIDLRRFDPIEWRKGLSVVFQDYIHYNLTAKENIWIGDIQDSHPPGQAGSIQGKTAADGPSEKQFEKILSAARLSGADALIRSLPQGYNTQLGRMFQSGHELSIGEWQKLALARAFYRSGHISILDEPTSSLDPLAEAAVFKEFKSLIANRTAIIISHRFSTVRMADIIFVLEKGQLIEQGSHEQLMKLNGQYARMYRVQADKFH